MKLYDDKAYEHFEITAADARFIYDLRQLIMPTSGGSSISFTSAFENAIADVITRRPLQGPGLNHAILAGMQNSAEIRYEIEDISTKCADAVFVNSMISRFGAQDGAKISAKIYDHIKPRLEKLVVEAFQYALSDGSLLPAPKEMTPADYLAPEDRVPEEPEVFNDDIPF